MLAGPHPREQTERRAHPMGGAPLLRPRDRLCVALRSVGYVSYMRNPIQMLRPDADRRRRLRRGLLGKPPPWRHEREATGALSYLGR